MQDPVSGFTYPEEWILLCRDEQSRLLVSKGLAVLASDGTVRKRGFTTGSTAAAAAKAAVLSLTKNCITEVSILTPAGIRIHVPVTADRGTGECVKYSGDYPGDVTAGMTFSAEVVPSDSKPLHFDGEWRGGFAIHPVRDRDPRCLEASWILNAVRGP